jgi:hypothetical protein
MLMRMSIRRMRTIMKAGGENDDEDSDNRNNKDVG